jgi:fimbrial isopeptide formation D2 family protein
VRGITAIAIVAATALSFNVISTAPSAAASGTLSNWLAIDGSIRYIASDGGQFGWGNQNTGSSSCPSGAVNVPGTNGLFNCGSPVSGRNPNPPTAANGDSSILSRDFLTDASGGEGTQGCPSATEDSTAFTSSAKFGALSDYTNVGPSQVNSKEDLSDAYFVARTQQASDPSPGDKELYFGLERAGHNGDVAVNVEFLQAGSHTTGCTGSLIENREQGDFTLEFDWVNGGSVPQPIFQVWDCTGTSAGNPPVGTSCDVNSPATPGNPSFPTPGYVTETFPASAVSVAENASAAIPCGGWVCANNSTSVDTAEFVEGGIDLAGVGVQSSCASTVLAFSHESQSPTSNMVDFTGPGNFSTCPSTTTTTPILPTSHTIGNSWSDSALVQGQASSGSPAGTVTFYSCSPSQLAAASASTCSNTIGTQIPNGGGITNPVTLVPGANNASSATSPPITPNEVGTWCFAGYYSGDPGKYAASNDSSSDECFTVNPAPSTTTTQQSLNSSGSGTIQIGNGVWNDVATVDGVVGGGSPTGSVEFFECGPTPAAANCSTSGTPLSTNTLSPGGGTNNAQATSASVPIPTQVGTYCFSAVYVPATSPPALYSTSSDNAPGQPIDDNECVDVTTAPSVTVTQQSLNSSGEGSIVIGPGVTWHDKVTVEGNSAGGAPTGTVKFFGCGPTSIPALCASTGTPFDTETLSAGGGANDAQATSANVPTPSQIGTYCFAAVYVPATGSNYQASSDNTTGDPVDPNECVTVTPANSATTTQQSTTTSGPGSIVIGAGTWTDTATVQGNSAGGPPTGVVFFFECGPTTANALCTPSSPWTQVGSSSGVTLTPGGGANNSQATSDQVPIPTQVGTYCFAAIYAPETTPTPANYGPSSDNTTGDPIDPNECVNVTPAESTTLTQQSLDSSGEGTVVIGPGVTWHDTATVEGNSAGGAPTGTVKFFECGPNSAPSNCSTSGTPFDTVTLAPGGGANNSQANSINVPLPTAVGVYCFSAVYVPSTDPVANYLGSSDNAPGEAVDANECVSVTPATSTTTTQNSLASGTEGSIVIGPGITWNDVATVEGNSAGGTPTGTVKFFECGPDSGPVNCSTSGTPFDTKTLSAGGGANNAQATSANVPTPTQIGTYCFSAVYVPASNSNYQGSSDNAPGEPIDSNECVVVGNAPSTTTTQQSTTDSGPGSIVIGPDGTWTDLATVAGNSAGGAPTGTVTFFVCGPTTGNALCTPSSPWTQLGGPVGLTTGSDDTSTAPSASFGPPTQVGTYCFAAVYTPDSVSNYAGSTDNTTGDPVDPNECVTVTPAPSTTTTQQSLSSEGGGSVTIGAGVTWTDTATVQGNSAGGAPQGTISFFECGPTSAPALCTDGTQVGSDVNLTAGESDSSTATSAEVPTPTQVGFYCFAAVYNPPDSGSNYLGSSDNEGPDIQANECVDVTPATPDVSTQQSGSDSGLGTIVLGSSIVDTATLTGNTAGGAPTGTVTFTECGPTTAPATCADGTQVGSDVTLTSSGTDTSTAESANFTPTAVGTYCFAAVYNPSTDPVANYVSASDNTSGDVQTSECFTVTTPDFQVIKTDVPGNGLPVTPGSTIPYTVTINNIGNGGGSGVVTDTLPSNLTIQGTPSCAVTAPDTCTVANPSGSTWTFSFTLAAGGTATVTFNAVVSSTDTADVVNTATITTGPCDNGQTPSSVQKHAVVDNCSSTVTNPVPNFTVTKTDTPGNGQQVQPGSNIPYTVTIKNVGDGAGTATVTDTLPSNLTIQGTPSCAVTAPDTCVVTNTTGSTWTFVVNLAAGNTATVTFTATVAATDSTTVTNTATITTGPCNTSAGCSSTVSNPVPPPVTSPSTTPSTTTTTAAPVTKPLAFTGADIAALAAAGLTLLGLGGLLVLISRRRRQAGDTG